MTLSAKLCRWFKGFGKRKPAEILLPAGREKAAERRRNDEIRLKILKILWNGQATTQSLAEILHLLPSAVSLHLKQLKEASLVNCYKEGKFVYYYANPSVINRMHNSLTSYFEK